MLIDEFIFILCREQCYLFVLTHIKNGVPSSFVPLNGRPVRVLIYLLTGREQFTDG